MLALGLFLTVCGLTWLAIHRAQPDWYARIFYPLEHVETIRAEAKRYELEPALIAAVIRQESGWVPDSRSAPGAVGLMQVLPSTARFIATHEERPSPPPDQLEDPAVNIAYGSWYLRYLIGRYGSTRAALVAYNAGETNLAEWVAKARADGRDFAFPDDVPFPETRAFVADVEHDVGVYRRAYRAELG
jgi:soluble lytic murein transglycosylase